MEIWVAHHHDHQSIFCESGVQLPTSSKATTWFLCRVWWGLTTTQFSVLRGLVPASLLPPLSLSPLDSCCWGTFSQWIALWDRQLSSIAPDSGKMLTFLFWYRKYRPLHQAPSLSPFLSYLLFPRSVRHRWQISVPPKQMCGHLWYQNARHSFLQAPPSKHSLLEIL